MIKFEAINKTYDDTIAVNNLNLEINTSEFVVIIGPSGCGKTSLIRMLCGLDKQTSGNIYIDSENINDLEPSERGISLMQQRVSLFPHLNVYDNICIKKELEKKPKNEIDNIVNEIAETLEIKPLLKRKPKEISGGEAQRVALARCLISGSKILVYDEPLSAIDAKLRVDMRKIIKDVHNKCNLTSIYITHDQVEAMSLADKIVVMNEGKITQIGKPLEIYDDPNDAFTAGFISKMNFITDGDVIMGIRPSDIKLGGDKKVLITGSEIIGKVQNVFAKYNDTEIEFELDSHYELNEYEFVEFSKTYYFDSNTKLRIRR